MKNIMEFQEDNPHGIPDALSPDQLLLKFESYEGPIDLLLTLARDQKVDLATISILALAEQYLNFIDQAKNLKLEIAADYLVMAAWLAYLKSKLLVPQTDDEDGEEELSGEALAEALAYQLKRLEAMQKTAELLFDLPQTGRDVFTRQQSSNNVGIETISKWQADLYDVLAAYGAIARRQEYANYTPKTWTLMSTDEAYERLSTMLGALPRKDNQSVWAVLDSFMPDDLTDALIKRSSKASLFTATLEMAKQGEVDIRQDGLFKPIYIRQKDAEE
jgi:segregation and condensation protein A